MYVQTYDCLLLNINSDDEKEGAAHIFPAPPTILNRTSDVFRHFTDVYATTESGWDQVMTFDVLTRVATTDRLLRTQWRFEGMGRFLRYFMPHAGFRTGEHSTHIIAGTVWNIQWLSNRNEDTPLGEAGFSFGILGLYLPPDDATPVHSGITQRVSEK